MMMMMMTLLFITGIQTTHQWFSKGVPWHFGCYVMLLQIKKSQILLFKINLPTFQPFNLQRTQLTRQLLLKVKCACINLWLFQSASNLNVQRVIPTARNNAQWEQQVWEPMPYSFTLDLLHMTHSKHTHQKKKFHKMPSYIQFYIHCPYLT